MADDDVWNMFQKLKSVVVFLKINIIEKWTDEMRSSNHLIQTYWNLTIMIMRNQVD